MTEISIVTINLNNLQGLSKTVESVFAQEFDSFEYIVIDGGSTDGSYEYLQKFQSRLQILVSEKDNGIYDAMNKGLRFAKGTYVLFLNSGDYLYDALSLKNMAKKSGHAEIVYGNMATIQEGVVKVQRYPSRINMNYFFKETLPHPSTLIKTVLFQKIGTYKTNYHIVSDWAFFVDAIVVGKASYQHVDMIVSVFNLDGISSRPESHRFIRREMDDHLSTHYPIYFLQYKLMWAIRYYPRRILQKLGLIDE